MTIMDTIMGEYQEQVCIVDVRTVPDGFGSFIPTYVDGAEFTAAITPDESTTAQIAQAQTEKKRCRITTSDNITLLQGYYVKILSTGETYKILHSNTNKLAPESSTISSTRSTTMEQIRLA